MSCVCKTCVCPSHETRKNFENTERLLRHIDSRINTHLGKFKAFGRHSGECKHKTNTVECCWHFSDYFCHYVGRSAIIVWLESCAASKISFTSLFQDFAFFAVFLNDINLVANLARGVALYTMEFASRIFDSNDNILSTVEQIPLEENYDINVQRFKVDTLDVLKKCGWLTNPLMDRNEAIVSSFRTIQSVMNRLQLILVYESQQRTSQPQFQLIGRALIASFCIPGDKILGLYFLEYFGFVLPCVQYTKFATHLKPILRRITNRTVCEMILLRFVNHARMQMQQHKTLRDELGRVLMLKKAEKRIILEQERMQVGMYLETCRFTLLDFFFNYLYYSEKIVLFLHMNANSLAFLNTFRVDLWHKRDKLPGDFSYEMLMSTRSHERLYDNDFEISTAPYCFNCGTFIENVWENFEKMPLVKQSVGKQSGLNCVCYTVRYCSLVCSKLHSGTHAATCSAEYREATRSH